MRPSLSYQPPEQGPDRNDNARDKEDNTGKYQKLLDVDRTKSG